MFIQRDYSEGTSVKFQTKFPPELEGKVSIPSCIPSSLSASIGSFTSFLPPFSDGLLEECTLPGKQYCLVLLSPRL